MKTLLYDPADGIDFWEAIRKLPGFPTHETMPIKEMIFDSDALFRITEVLKNVGAQQNAPLVVVMDETPMQRNREDLKELILKTLKNEGWEIQVAWMCADESRQVHTDMPHIRQVQASLRRGCSVLSVGSGVVTDITKHGCFLHGQETGESVPLVVYQTANSVSAFTSNMAPTFIDGVKRTLDSRYPDALICDLETLRDAPVEYTFGGIGDMLAVFVSFPDWYLAHCLGMDSTYSELAKSLVGPLDEVLLAHAEGIKNGEMESVAVLAKLISLGGLAMSLSHATTPMSGFEHVMSHVLDLQAEINHAPLTVHGSQVALATLAGMEMYQRFLSDFDPATIKIQDCFPTLDAMKERIFANFGTIDPSGKAAAECWVDYQQKLEKWHAHRSDFESALGDWNSLRTELLKETRSSDVILQILQKAGAPVHWSQLKPAISEEQARFAFMNASLMRKRLTLGDILIFTGWERESIWKDIWQQYA